MCMYVCMYEFIAGSHLSEERGRRRPRRRERDCVRRLAHRHMYVCIYVYSSTQSCSSLRRDFCCCCCCCCCFLLCYFAMTLSSPFPWPRPLESTLHLPFVLCGKRLVSTISIDLCLFVCLFVCVCVKGVLLLGKRCWQDR